MCLCLREAESYYTVLWLIAVATHLNDLLNLHKESVDNVCDEEASLLLQSCYRHLFD